MEGSIIFSPTCWETQSAKGPEHLYTLFLGVLRMQGPDYPSLGLFLRVAFAESNLEQPSNIFSETESKLAYQTLLKQ